MVYIETSLLDDVSPSVSGTNYDFVNNTLSQSQNNEDFVDDKEEDNCDNDEEDDDEINNEILEDFEEAIKVFVKSSKQRLQEDQSYSKAIKSFTKSLRKLVQVRKVHLNTVCLLFPRNSLAPKEQKTKKANSSQFKQQHWLVEDINTEEGLWLHFTLCPRCKKR